MAYGMTKVDDPKDPDRCKTSTSKNQCTNKAVEGTDHCKAHGGAMVAAKNETAAINRFMHTKYYDAIKKEHDQASLKSLHGEVAVLKMLLTHMLGRIKDDHDLTMNISGISDLIAKTDKLVTSCHKLDKDLSLLVDQNTVMKFAMDISEVIMDELEDQPAKLQHISMKIAVAFNNLIQTIGDDDDE